MNRWELGQDNTGIVWRVEGDECIPHTDHIEMSGTKVSLYVSYGASKERKLKLQQKIIYPTLRKIPNDTHASLITDYEEELFPEIYADGVLLQRETVAQISFDGILRTAGKAENIAVSRVLFPTRELLCTIERITLKNTGNSSIKIFVPEKKGTRYARGCHGVYVLEHHVKAITECYLSSQEEVEIEVVFSGRLADEKQPTVSGSSEEEKRKEHFASVMERLCLTTPDRVVNQAFAFSKYRAAESVFLTRGGYMHCPGGLSYYAAVWTNDQVEYAGPFFPYLGDKNAIAASQNAYELYLPFMGEDFRAIPSSIIAEGHDIWEGAGDRGDAAMYAYGAANFVLENGDREYAKKLWPAIRWCLSYCEKKKTADGVIASDTDELENRFSSGDANLSTSLLAYGAYRAAACLAEEFGEAEYEEHCLKEKELLGEAIEAYFGANVQGFNTYRYYDGNDKLRAWICLPLVFGINHRREETLRALFSEYLWKPDGLATESGSETFWDRSTLYALRGAFYAGAREQAYEHLREYSIRRVLGEHVPYPVEAYPEGNQQHLSAESALYCRIFTEGILGMIPTSFRSFSLTVNMPAEWKHMKLAAIQAYQKEFSIEVSKYGNGRYQIIISMGEKEKIWEAASGETLSISLEELE